METSGVDMGRNIWQSDYPVQMLQAVRSIVHNAYNADDAFSKFISRKVENAKIKLENN